MLRIPTAGAYKSGRVAHHSFVNAPSSNIPSPLENAELYGVVDLDYHLSAETAAVAAERLLEGGVDVLQLRARRLPHPVFAGLAGEILAMTAPLGVPLIIEGFPELLREVPAEGLHLAHESISIEEARARAGRPIVVGKDTHTMAEALSAAEQGADYLGYGPLFDNPLKPGLPAAGLEEIAAIEQILSIPIFCRGGITLDNLGQVRAAGGRRVIMVSAWLEAGDIAAAVRSARGVLAAD